MADSTLFQFNRCRTQAVRKAVESWQIEHATALMALDAEEAVRECLGFPEDLRRLWNSTLERIAHNQIDDLQEVGLALGELFDDVVQTLGSVQPRVQQIEQAGYNIARGEELAHAREKLIRLKHIILEHWPWLPTAGEVAECQAALARGDFQTAGEILHELQGKNP